VSVIMQKRIKEAAAPSTASARRSQIFSGELRP
jgi:hypothetical protein